MKHPLLTLRPWQRHSLVLAVAGGIFVALGVITWITPTAPAAHVILKLQLDLMPLKAWGVAFGGVGLLALASTVWPPASKTWGYTALAALSSLWASLYLIGVAFDGEPHSNLWGASVWYLLSFLWWAISGLANPDDVPKGE